MKDALGSTSDILTYLTENKHKNGNAPMQENTLPMAVMPMVEYALLFYDRDKNLTDSQWM